jgi:hypothetical protein
MSSYAPYSPSAIWTLPPARFPVPAFHKDQDWTHPPINLESALERTCLALRSALHFCHMDHTLAAPAGPGSQPDREDYVSRHRSWAASKLEQAVSDLKVLWKADRGAGLSCEIGAELGFTGDGEVVTGPSAVDEFFGEPLRRADNAWKDCLSLFAQISGPRGTKEGMATSRAITTALSRLKSHASLFTKRQSVWTLNLENEALHPKAGSRRGADKTHVESSPSGQIR